MGWLVWAAAAAALGGGSAQCFRKQSHGVALSLALGAMTFALLALAAAWMRI
jgi:hypothetical protein